MHTRAQFRGQVRLIDSRRALIKARPKQEIAFYPHGTLVHFGWKKVVAQCCGHASPHRTRHWQGVPGARFSTDQGGSFVCPRLKPISKFTNSSIRGGPSGVPEAHPPKRPFSEKYVILHARDACKFCRFFRWGPPVECRRGSEWTFSWWCPAGLKRVLRKFSGNPQISVSRR